MKPSIKVLWRNRLRGERRQCFSPGPIMREIGRNFLIGFFMILMTASATNSTHIMPIIPFIPPHVLCFFYSNPISMMMILMWSNIGFKLSARMTFPGNFQPLKVHLSDRTMSERAMAFRFTARGELRKTM